MLLSYWDKVQDKEVNISQVRSITFSTDNTQMRVDVFGKDDMYLDLCNIHIFYVES